jgi:hypothetical protein
MIMSSKKNGATLLHAVLLAATGLCSAAASVGATLAPATFTNDVLLNGTSTCPDSINTTTDGYCWLGSSVAHSDGGIAGTPGYDPSASPGTHLSALATTVGVTSVASMTYLFEVNGPPAPGGQIAVDILSSGAASVLAPTGTGQSWATASLAVTNDGSGTVGGPDPLQGAVVDSHFDNLTCSGSGCVQTGLAWNQTDALCLTQGYVYQITIQASSFVSGKGTTGSAAIDPRIIVDPTQVSAANGCFQPANPLDYPISISPGASTGGPTATPEPSALALMGLGLLALGLGRGSRRRAPLHG